MRSKTSKKWLVAVPAVLALGIFVQSPAPPESDDSSASLSVIVQSRGDASAADLVRDLGGEITHELDIIGAVAANLTPAAQEALSNDARVRVHANHAIETAGKRNKDTGEESLAESSANNDQDTSFPSLVSANLVHDNGIEGHAVGIAVLDTGLWRHEGILNAADGSRRLIEGYNAITDSAIQLDTITDPGGHGTHIASVAASSVQSKEGLYNGIAPSAELISVRAFDDHGGGTYADVIRAIDWVVANADRLAIRILNLSFSAEPRSNYWDDPINQAVMAAWQSGIVVVAAAGNRGPDPMTVGVPGNTPYVITVGAMTDSDSPSDPSDDLLATFSSMGPTHEGFVKPEVVAPGGHMLGLMDKDSYLATTYPEFFDGGQYFSMSGTSQATAVVSGIVALMLERQPGLTPDQVKCRLMSTARPAVDSSGNLAYSVFQQGAGLVDAFDAVNFVLKKNRKEGTRNDECANVGLDVDYDLAGTQHYGGRADQAADGSFYLTDLQGDGYMWSDGLLWSDALMWSDGYMWSDGLLWSDALLWSDGYTWYDQGTGLVAAGFLWTDALMWSDGYLWSDSLTEVSFTSTWVAQE